MTKAASSSGARVLVVEDEALTRMSAVAMLQDAGYDVVEADNGTAAMLALERIVGIRAILTDIDMPAGLDGITLAACVDFRWPNIAVIMTSGKVKPVPGDIPNRARFLPKPYTPEDVLAALAEMFGKADISVSLPQAGAEQRSDHWRGVT